MEDSPLASFSADQAVSLRWEDCKTTQRVSQLPRKEYKAKKGSTSSDADSETSNTITLNDWDDWFGAGPSSSGTAPLEPIPDSDSDSE